MQQKLNIPKENTSMSNILMEHSSEPYLFNGVIDKKESYSRWLNVFLLFEKSFI